MDPDAAALAEHATPGARHAGALETAPSEWRAPAMKIRGRQLNSGQATMTMPITDTNQASVRSQGTPIR